ncbi:MAG: phosphopyruvate hydratase [Parcubacteria group bacterium]|nr:phosphopyruvate hydratase [Parcubacteria group bacterium]
MSIPSQKITKCSARQITDSRGMATIEVEISAGELDIITAKAAVPSGKSTGSQEAFVMRDADGGMGRVIESVEKVIAPKILKMDVDAEAVDRIMFRLDMTQNKTILGANATIGVSMAMTRLEAKIKNIPLWKFIAEKSGNTPGKPLLYVNTLNGGVHADFCLPFQEYIAVVGGATLAAAYEKSKAVFEKVREKLNAEQADYYMGDEGGFAVRFDTLEKPFEVLSECTASDKDIFLAIDAAASEFYKNGKYEVLGRHLGRGELLVSYKPLVEKFNVKSIEDPFEEHDMIGFQEAMQWFGDSALIVGDDLTATNPRLVEEIGKKGLANAVIIKPNQIGTMTEVYDVIWTARRYGWKIIVSHRSGETLDPFIADLAVGVGAYGIKAGAYMQPERAAKYERLMEIEKEMNGTK